MGSGENIWAFLVGLAAFAGWTLSRFTVPRRVGWANVVSGLGILALSFSNISLDDDGFQQELICPATPSVPLSERTRVAPRRSLSGSSINPFVEAGDPIRVPMTSRSFDWISLLSSTRNFHGLQSQSTPPFASSEPSIYVNA
jgi:hypothetical protein